jgi:hypothetical protein
MCGPGPRVAPLRVSRKHPQHLTTAGPLSGFAKTGGAGARAMLAARFRENRQPPETPGPREQGDGAAAARFRENTHRRPRRECLVSGFAKEPARHIPQSDTPRCRPRGRNPVSRKAMRRAAGATRQSGFAKEPGSQAPDSRDPREPRPRLRSSAKAPQGTLCMTPPTGPNHGLAETPPAPPQRVPRIWFREGGGSSRERSRRGGMRRRKQREGWTAGAART